MICVAILAVWIGFADDYRKPPPAVMRILEAPPLPMVSLDPTRSSMLLINRITLPPIEDFAAPMLRLAGARINPMTNGRHGPRRFTGITLRDVESGKEIAIALPENSNIGMPDWSPNGSRFAFSRTASSGIELWVGEKSSGKVRRIDGVALNETMGAPFTWLPDSEHLLCRTLIEGRGKATERSAVPEGPVIQETSGKTATMRTYQDLLQDAHDEVLFDYYMSSQLCLVNVGSGQLQKIGKPAVFGGVDPSPDGAYLLVSRVLRPYSYLVPSSLFPESVEVWKRDGSLVAEIARLPLRDNIPNDGVETGPRRHRWRNSAAATLVWVEALDEGNPKNKVPHRDRLWIAEAPFAKPRELLKTEHRYRGLQWLESASLGLLEEYDRDRRWTRTWLVDVDAAASEPRLLWDRSARDVYHDPGNPVTAPASNGVPLVMVEDGCIYLSGRGATEAGDRPFLDRLRLEDFQSERLWQCEGEHFESVVDLLSRDGGAILTSSETKVDPPNYFLRTLADGARRQVTFFKDPSPEFSRCRKELVKYLRADGVELSATLYLPADRKEGERLPLVVWAYPLEYSDPATAGQVSGSPYRFTSVGGISHLFFLTQGYAIMDNATMPVIGDPEHCNDTFVEQIVMSAKAAIAKAAEMGVADPNRVGVGGHSYGAFMTANLLAHCDLFRAGIARSGAYNRTLTPFGFQSEPRTFWEAPDTYFRLSPYMHAHTINEPLLLIHGQLDNNQGTFPLQSERMYQAVKGHGGTARLVMLPLEAHGYQARESVQHTLAEMMDWFDEHVKGVPASAN